MRGVRRVPLLLAALVAAGVGPCGPVPGGRLDGPVVAEPVSNWSFSDAFERCQLEVGPHDPHSVHVSCYADGPRLYVGSVQGAVKRWTAVVAEDPRVRVRVAGRVHLLRALRVDDPAERVAAARARARKYEGADPGPELVVPEDYWIFRLAPR